jgi:rRNA-processing protein FCF1
MDILLDTNFILTCTKQKIDFAKIADEIINEDITWIVPQQVLNELGNIKDKKGTKKQDKQAAELSFEILQTLNPKIIELNKNPNIDIAIVNHIIDKPIVLATLDKKLKQRVPNNRILTIRDKNYLELVQ